MNIIELLVALVIILIAAELFTNGIEWFGHKLNLAEGAVGSVLAAVGTALPETMIPLVAIITATGANDAAHEVGVGAILGAPFMLATLAMFVTGLGVIFWAKRRANGRQMKVDTGVLGMDIRYFFVAYAIAVGAALIPAELSYLRYGAVIALLAVYAWYVKSHFEADPNVDAADLTPLRFRRVDLRHHRSTPDAPRLRVVSLQVLVALALIIGGAVVFVDAVEHIASDLGL
ncbi:MAG: cation:H+ antiporter, partial [Chloroflexota bacterium]|nr:cation:H+ antiporter [Chloroflexota bacterium]